MTRKDRLNINLPAELIEQARAQADILGTSVSIIIERLLVNWIAEGGAMPAPTPKSAKNDIKRKRSTE